MVKIYKLQVNVLLFFVAILFFACSNNNIKSKKYDFTLKDYKEESGVITLPESAEKLLLRKVNSKQIVDIQEIVYTRRASHDYLGIAASFEINWSFESVYHQTFILEKKRENKSWSNAKIYYLGNSYSLNEIFNLPYKRFKRILIEHKW